MSAADREAAIARHVQRIVWRAQTLARATAQLVAEGIPAEQAERLACHVMLVEVLGDEVSSAVRYGTEAALQPKGYGTYYDAVQEGAEAALRSKR